MATYLYHKVPCHSFNELYKAFMTVHSEFKYIKSINVFKNFYNSVGLDNLDKQADYYSNCIGKYYIYKNKMYNMKNLFKYNNFLNKLSYDEQQIAKQYLFNKTNGQKGLDITDLIDNHLAEHIKCIHLRRKRNTKINEQAKYIYEHNKSHKLTLYYIKKQLRNGWTPDEILNNSRGYWKHRYSKVKKYEYNSKEYTANELYKIVNKINPMPRSAFNWRISTHWSMDKIINTPIKKHPLHIKAPKSFKYTYKGITYTRRKDLYNILTKEKVIFMSAQSFNNRIQQGWSVEKILANPIAKRRSSKKNIL